MGSAKPTPALLDAAAVEVLGKPLGYSAEALTEILSPRHFVEVRRTLGGPAPDETLRAAQVSRQLLQADEDWWTNATEALGQAERTLAERSAAL
jgi:argininosuccinate lyase